MMGHDKDSQHAPQRIQPGQIHQLSIVSGVHDPVSLAKFKRIQPAQPSAKQIR